MAQNLKKVSEFDPLTYSSLLGNDLLYIVHRVGGSTESYNLSISDLFLGTNNLSTDIKFRSDTLVVANGRVGINEDTPLYTLDVNGSLQVDGVSQFNSTANAVNIIVNDTLTVSTLKSKSTSNPKSSYQELIGLIYPVGAIYMSTNSQNPSTTFGVGTWEEWGQGRVPVGVKSTDALFNVFEKTGGSKDAVVVEHGHVAASNSSTSITMTDPGHDHGYKKFNSASDVHSIEGDKKGWENYPEDTDKSYTGITISASTTTSTTIHNSGVSGENKNIQPYITCYMWKRTA